jgi:hypothetical protein
MCRKIPNKVTRKIGNTPSGADILDVSRDSAVCRIRYDTLFEAIMTGQWLCVHSRREFFGVAKIASRSRQVLWTRRVGDCAWLLAARRDDETTSPLLAIGRLYSGKYNYGQIKEAAMELLSQGKTVVNTMADVKKTRAAFRHYFRTRCEPEVDIQVAFPRIVLRLVSSAP